MVGEVLAFRHVKTGRKPFTGGKLRLISTRYRSVFGILRPVLRHGRMSLHPVATAVRRSRCGALLWIQARVQGHVRFVDRDGCREVDKDEQEIRGQHPCLSEGVAGAWTQCVTIEERDVLNDHETQEHIRIRVSDRATVTVP